MEWSACNEFHVRDWAVGMYLIGCITHIGRGDKRGSTKEGFTPFKSTQKGTNCAPRRFLNSLSIHINLFF